DRLFVTILRLHLLLDSWKYEFKEKKSSYPSQGCWYADRPLSGDSVKNRLLAVDFGRRRSIEGEKGKKKRKKKEYLFPRAILAGALLPCAGRKVEAMSPR
ncbi:hypothetical protein GW17_00052456, partial [Ensete ventricosum]